MISKSPIVRGAPSGRPLARGAPGAAENARLRNSNASSPSRSSSARSQELERFEPFAQLVGEVLVAPKQLLDGLTTAVLSLGVPLAEDLSHALLITHVVPRALS